MVFNGMVTLVGFYLDASSILKCELDMVTMLSR